MKFDKVPLKFANNGENMLKIRNHLERCRDDLVGLKNANTSLPLQKSASTQPRTALGKV